MTTNQTIDGVPRELLERLLTDACNENWSDLNELLHSATTCRCKRYGKGNPHWPCPAHPAPAAQPQGEPVAWMFKYLSHSDSPPYRTFEVTDFHQNPKAPGIAEHTPLYAEQPAPVAVVLPDPGPDQQVEARAKEIYEGWSYNPGFAPWVDGGNSIMQSRARDLARRELASK